MWYVFIPPLIEPCLFFNITNSQFNKIMTRTRSTFKSMCGISKTVKNKIVDQFIEIDIEKLTQRKIRRAQSKWEARRRCTEINQIKDNNEEEEKKIIKNNRLDQISNEMMKVINIMNRTYCNNVINKELPYHTQKIIITK